MLGHQCTLTRGDDDAADGNCGGDGDDDDRESLLCAIFKGAVLLMTIQNPLMLSQPRRTCGDSCREYRTMLLA